MKSEKKKVIKKHMGDDIVPIARLKGTDRSRILALQIEIQHDEYVKAVLRPKPPLPSPCSGTDCFLPLIDKNMPLVNPRRLKANLFVPYIEMVRNETMQVRFCKFTKDDYGILKDSIYEIVTVSTDKDNPDQSAAPVTFMKKIPITKNYPSGYYSVEITDASSNIIRLFFMLED